MKKARNFWRDLPQGGSRYGSVLTRLFLLLCLLATTQAGWAATPASAGTYTFGNQTIGGKNKFYKYNDGVFLYRQNNYNKDQTLGIKLETTVNNGTGFAIYISSGMDLTVTVKKKSTKNEVPATITVYPITNGETAFTTMEGGTNNSTTVNLTLGSSATVSDNITFPALTNNATAETTTSTMSLSEGYYYIEGSCASGMAYMYSFTLTSSGGSSTVNAPTFNPPSGNVTVGDDITLATATAGATIHWKWDNNTDVASSTNTGTTASTAALSAGSHTLYAVAVKDGTNSALASATYTVNAASSALTAQSNHTWNFSSSTPSWASSYTTTTINDNLEMVASLSKGSSAKTFDGTSYSNYYTIQNSGSTGYFHFKAAANTKITVYANSGGSSNRRLIIEAGSTKGSGTTLLDKNWGSSGIKIESCTNTAENDIWVYNQGSSSVQVYLIKVEPAATQYDINNESATNGSFVTKVSGATVTKASEGDMVTVSLTPNNGFVTNTVTVTKNGGDVECTGSANTWTFEMPGEDVTVTATFKMATPSRTVISGSATNTGTNEYSYAGSLTLKLTRPASATKMYYTLDGTDPTSSATRVEVTTNEVTLPEFTEASTTLKYYATDGVLSSDVVGITLINTAAGKTDPTLSWPKTSETATMGVAFTSPTLTKDPEGLTVTYDSSNKSVATVNTSGVVTLVGAGTTTISAIFAGNEDYNAKTVTYTLTVNNQTVTLAWATAGAKSMTKNETYTNAAAATSTATSEAPLSGTVTYSSSNTSVATVTSEGVVTAVAPGTATITASYAANGIYNAATPITYEVTVRAASSGKVWDFTADESANYAAATTYWQVDGNSTNYFKSKFSASSAPYQSTYVPENDTPAIEMLKGIRFKRDGSSMSTGNYRWYVPKNGNDGYLRFGGSKYGIVLTGLTAGTTYTIDCQASGNNDFVISNADITEFGTTTRGETQFKVAADKTEVFIYAKNSDSKIFKITEGASTTVTVADPTVTPKTGSEEDNTFATNSKTVDFACTTDDATVKYVVGTTKQTDIGAIKNGSTGGSNTSVDVSAGVSEQCNLWISAVAVKEVNDVAYTSDPVYVELVYAGPKTAELRKTDIEMQSGNYSTISTRITDAAGNPLLFGAESVDDVDYTDYYDFSYEITAKTSDYITLQEVEGKMVVNSRVGDNKALANSTATVRVTATPKEGSHVEDYVANATTTLTVDVNVKILEETQGLGWVDFYWDEDCNIPITTTHQGVTGPAKDKTMVFDNFPNGKVIYLKMNTAEADTICFYYNNYDQTKPSANVSKTSGRSIITKNSTNSKLARSASYLYRHAIPIYMHEELTGDPAGKKVWVSVAGWKGTSTAKVGNIINMEFTLANNGLKSSSAGTRPDAPIYEPETTNSSDGTMTEMTTTQSSIAVGEPTGMIYAKYSTKDTYNIIHLVNMPSDDNPRTLNVGRGSVGVFSTVSSTSGTTRKTSGVQIVDGVVSDISNAFYKYYPAQKEVKMSFDKTDVTVHFNNTSAFVKPTLTITPAEGETHIRENVTYSYTGGDGRITGITNDGTITWKENPTPGVITVKASFAGDDYGASPSYARAEATYQIYVIDPDKEVVLIKPGSCDFYGQMDVTIEGANTWTGYYTTTENDTEPTFNASTWSVIEHAQSTQIHLTETTNVWAYVVDPETGQPKNGTHQKFTLKTVAKPTLYPDGVTSTYYFHGTSLQVTASTSVAEASVYYVVDGDKNELANGGGTRYEGRITLDDTKMHTIYAVTQDKDGHRSEIVTGTYMKASTLEQPWFNINNQPGGDFEGGQREINTSDKIYLVDKTGDIRAEIYYTVDGSSPTTSSTKYTDAFYINKSGTVVKAISVLLGDISEISTATFNFAASSENRFWEANSETCDKNGKLLANDGKSGAVISEANNSPSYVKYITATFGSIYKDSKDVWKHEKIGEESKGEPIDGVGTYQISTGYDALDENGDIYNHANSLSSKPVHERTFALPARGAYVRFEPEKDGDLTIWALQNGGVYYNESSDGKENFLSGFIRKRPVYMVDEQGNCLAATEVKAAGTLSDNWSNISRSDLLGKEQEEHSQGGISQDLFNTAEAQSIYDMYSAKIADAPNTDMNNLIVYLNDGNHPDAANAGITGGDASTGENIGVCIPSASYMRYTYKVRAGKTYFFFAHRTKLGIRGFRFDPDKTYTEQAITIDPTKENISDAISNYASLSDEKQTENVTVSRKFKDKTWAGLVLPFSVSRTQLKNVFGDDTEVLHVDHMDGYTLVLHKHHYGMIVAGTPVLIFPAGKNADIENPVFKGVQIETTNVTQTGDDNVKLTGSICQGDLKKNDMYLNANGNFQLWGGNTVKVSGTYAWLTGLKSETAARLTFRYTSYDDEDDSPVTTGIQIVTSGENNLGGFSGNGYIYTLGGQLVSKDGNNLNKLPKGVYIQNGKKIVVR